MTEYGKLVRDRIPEIIEADGHTPVTRVLNKDEYKQALLDKLEEESREFKDNPNMLELADVQEVIGAISVAYGFNSEHLESVRQERAVSRGGFEDRIFLIRVEEST
ncbi:MAG TPA: nucleoside triphosphate pyrophosphohydrolase [Candidatus Saccharimonadales bacterium]|nr:nucleoside triphosphate pyrophosphohydrolase [Candidatus Saccharimonadales bacterium]